MWEGHFVRLQVLSVLSFVFLSFSGGGGWGLGEEEGAKSSQEDEGEAQQRSYRSNTAAGAQDCKNKQTKTNKKIKI